MAGISQRQVFSESVRSMGINMEIRIAAATDWLRNGMHEQMERALHQCFAESACRVRQVAACLESLVWTKAQHGWECRVYVWLRPSGVKAARGRGDSAEAALRCAAEHLARSLETKGAALIS